MINTKKKLMFVITSMAGGGAEKVVVDIVNFLDPDKYDISLALFEKKGPYLNYLPKYVKIYDLNKKSRCSFIKLVLHLAILFRKIKPDTVISFMNYSNLISIISKILTGRKIRLVISVHIHLSSALRHYRFAGIKNYTYRRPLFNCVNSCFVPSEGVRRDLISSFGISEDKIKVVHNPINLSRIDKLKNEKFELLFGKYIIAAGRLTHQKGYANLIRAYSLICDEIEEKLVILGEGEQEKELKELTKLLGIEKRVSFLGFQENPYKYMKNASSFVLSSLFESFAIVIVEAMACGTPVIATDCPSGPGEIITDGINGILVPPGDEKALADAMLGLLKKPSLMRKYSEAGIKRAENFSIEKILPEYEALF